MFKKAERKRAKLRLALVGPSGSGKTYSALRIARGLGGKIALIDTEHGSGELYSDEFDYDIARIDEPYTPERYIECIKEAEKAGYDILIIDSISHAWAGQGGMLDMHMEVTEASRDKNSFTAWRKITPKQEMLINRILASSMHVIATMRAKTAYIMQEDGRGKQKPTKVGLEPIQRTGTDYEFTLVFNLEKDTHVATQDKTRARPFSDFCDVLTEDTGEMLSRWLNTGSDPTIGYYEIKSRFLAAASIEELKQIMDSHKKDIEALFEADRVLLRQAYTKRKEELSSLADRLFGDTNV